MGNENSGRLAKDENTRIIRKSLTEAGVHACKVIRDFVRGHDEKGHPVKISMTKLKACELALAHAIGRPKESIEFKDISQLNLKDLAELAELHDRKLTDTVETPVKVKVNTEN